MTTRGAKRLRLADCLEEVTQGVGPSWRRYRLLGATREGLAPAKEGVGKAPERYKLVEPGTIFYNPMRILLGSIALLEEGEEPGITSPDYVVFRTRPNVIHHRWFYDWLRSDDGAAFIRTLARGAVRERMLFRRLAEAEITVPSYEAQLGFARAAILVGRAHAAAEAGWVASESLADASLRDVFDRPAAPASRARRIGEFACTCSGTTPARGRRDYYGGTIPWVKTTELRDGVLRETEERITELALRECRLTVLPRDTLLVAMYGQGQTRGRTALLGVPATVNQACFAILPNPSVFDSKFLQLWFRRNYKRLRAETEGRGGNQPNLNGLLLRDQMVVLPPVDEQKRIIALLQPRLGDGARLANLLEREMLAIKKLRESLLRRAFSSTL